MAQFKQRSFEKEGALRQRMAGLNIKEEDIEESFLRSSGPGGQNVNKTATCVSLRHRPTGVWVKCQMERSQGTNRYQARLLLVEKIEGMRREERLRAVQQREKSRRQQRRRPASLKETILQRKKYVSEKKSFRHKIRPQDLDRF